MVWENDDWSLLKQTVVHFFIGSFAMLPVAYFSHWMRRSIAGFVSYFGMFIAIYAAIWLCKYINGAYVIYYLNISIYVKYIR